MSFPTNDTLGSLIEEVKDNLGSFGVTNDAVCTLTSPLDSTSTSFLVDDVDDIGKGIVEIDGEIMYVNAAENGTVQLPAWGRGYKGTTKTSHTAGTPVWISPTWPRATVAREINNMVRALYPQLFAVGTYEFDAGMTVTNQYAMPVDLERVLSVEWRWGGYRQWEPVRAWEMSHSSSVADFASGKSLIIGDPVPASTQIHVTYAKQPTAMVNESDLFSSTGLPTSCRDVVVLGVAQRLIPWQDTARIPVETVPSDMVDSIKPVGNAQTNAQYIRALYTARLEEEIRHQQSKYPMRAHKVR